MASQTYHKYVFDEKKRKFVGEFEKMYADEDRKNYDSWFQEDLTHLERQISLVILNRCNFSSILDIGCGKGAFTHLLKKANNRIVGVDISETAIIKAKSKYRNIEFSELSAEEALNLQEEWDLVVAMEILSYLENWKEILAKAAHKASCIYISLYLPPNPVGFVKNFDELKNEIRKYFDIDIEIICNNEHIFVFCRKRRQKL